MKESRQPHFFNQEDFIMSSGCTKKRTSKNIDIARITTLNNKIRIFTRIIKNNPNDHSAKNVLAQYEHDLKHFNKRAVTR